MEIKTNFKDIEEVLKKTFIKLDDFYILMGKNTYEYNLYNYLKRNGMAEKFDHAGIYCIRVNNMVVYIGKSHNMLRRIA